MTAAADRAREEQMAAEWRDWIGRSTGDLLSACSGALPVPPEVAAILAEWRAGGTELPWADAPGDKISSEQEEPSGVPAAGDVTAA